MNPLRTDRLLVREFAAADWPALHAFESLPEVARYQDFAPRTEEESRAYVLDSIEDPQEEHRLTYDMAVVLPAEDRLIGRCGLGISEPTIGAAALWYTLHPAYWGHGYMTEATRAMVDFDFRELCLHRIWAECDPANIASWRILEKIGMRREAHLRENAKIKGAGVDSLIYAILGRGWA
jgi:RimJ/RimL family protein N-acetyltransferase